MKTKPLFCTLSGLLVLTVIVFQACKKNETTNQLPTCVITAPTNGKEFIQGEDVIISADASDIDGSITEVRFFVDDIEKGASNSFPHKYQWATDNISVGMHAIRATSFDNVGGNKSDEITIKIIHAGYIGTFTDTRDGKTYNTVEIGSQTWFAENLNYETSNSWWYNNSTENGEVYGRLYIWDDALIACPNGWHLPGDDDWKVLEMYLGMSQSEADQPGWRGTDEGKKLKSTSGWAQSGNGTDVIGFTALPGGAGYVPGTSSHIGYIANWWSATESNTANAWDRYLHIQHKNVNRTDGNKDYGLSVRCIKD